MSYASIGGRDLVSIAGQRYKPCPVIGTRNPPVKNWGTSDTSLYNKSRWNIHRPGILFRIASMLLLLELQEQLLDMVAIV